MSRDAGKLLYDGKGRAQRRVRLDHRLRAPAATAKPGQETDGPTPEMTREEPVAQLELGGGATDSWEVQRARMSPRGWPLTLRAVSSPPAALRLRQAPPRDYRSINVGEGATGRKRKEPALASSAVRVRGWEGAEQALERAISRWSPTPSLGLCVPSRPAPAPRHPLPSPPGVRGTRRCARTPRRETAGPDRRYRRRGRRRRG